jgi:hypothetical protein
MPKQKVAERISSPESNDSMNESWDALKDSLAGAGWSEPTLEQSDSGGEVLIGKEVYVLVRL